MSRSEVTSTEPLRTASATVPDSHNDASAAAASLNAAFTGTFEPTEVSRMYRVGLVLTTFGMALLLAVYVGLILFTSYGVFHHLRYGEHELHTPSGNPVGHFFLAVTGAIVVFFLIKPCFAGKPEEPPRYSLTPKSDPALFAFITQICEHVRAPVPSRVDVDCRINASAGFRRGLLSMRGDDVVLTIGLPLVAGLNMQEFAGVLAHEFGHFAQGAGMRLTYIIRMTDFWFARVVYERDRWDEAIHQAAWRVDLRLGIFLHLIRFTIWLSRRLLWLLMHVGHTVSCFMLRQMEYDADSYEAKLAGSVAFAQTTAKVESLNAASLWVSNKMNETWRNNRLPENLPGFIALAVRNVPHEIRDVIAKNPQRKTTRMFDTHPCDADRVRAAAAMNQPGIFHLTEPAEKLFSDFAGLARGATRFHYEANLRLRITEQNLVPHEALVDESVSQSQGADALREYFFGLKWNRPVTLSVPEDMPLLPESTADLVANLKRARQAMEESQATVRKAFSEYEAAEQLYQRGMNALSQGSQQATERATAAMQPLIPVLETFGQNANVRLSCALRLFERDEVASKVAEAQALRREAAQLTRAFAKLGQALTPLGDLRRNFGAFETALNAHREPRLAKTADQRIAELAPLLQNTMKEIHSALEGLPYPFQHPRQDITVEEFARPELAASTPIQTLFNNCSCRINRLYPLYARVLGRLTFIARKVEEQI
jgi:hypothetical protein